MKTHILSRFACLLIVFSLAAPALLAQNADLETYLKENDIAAPKSSSGLYYVVEKEGQGRYPADGDKVTVHYTGKLLNGDKFDSSLDRNQPFSFDLGKGQVISGWEEGLKLFKKGGKGTLYLPPELAYGDREIPGLIPPNSPLIFEIEVIEVQTPEEYEKAKQQALEAALKKESEQIEAYLEEKDRKAEKTESGLYYIIEKPGDGAAAEAGKTVSVHYSGRLLSTGQQFDSSYDRDEPISFPLGQGRVIKGWDEGIALFKEGGKGTLFIPSPLGYGKSGAGAAIPPNATLIFDIELVEVK